MNKRKAIDNARHDGVQVWECKLIVEKRQGDWTNDDITLGLAPEPYEIKEEVGNLLTTNGATDLWTALTGGSISGGYFSNANANIGVGDSSTAAAVGQTDLQAATNKLRKGMDSTYPLISTNTIQFQSTFGSSEANFVWNEFAIFNAASSGRMLNRAVASLGTKASGASWTFRITVTLS